MSDASPLEPLPAPKTKRGERTRQKILDAAEREIGRKGFSEASISTITAEAAVGQGTFYLYFRTKEDVLANLQYGEEQIVDARGAPRFTGEELESRPGVASGHIPGARNVPYKALYNEDGTFKDKAALAELFAKAGVDLDRPVVTTCGSGMTACILAFALHLIGKRDVALYDGSWSEWGADPATPKATGPA